MARSIPADRTACRRCGNAVDSDAACCDECGLSTGTSHSIAPALPGLQIIRVLGAGGAAQVFLARQESLDRMVAVKVLRAAGDDAAASRAFRREARAISRLTGHPHVVSVYSAGRTDTGQNFLVTEYMEGGSLADLLGPNHSLPPHRVASIGVGIADALIAAHELGIHHRDVKPANVLLTRDGRAKLADFGIARLLSGQSITTTDVYAFTPEHVAPEVLRREPDGPWTDVYGLASTLATALLGVAPIRAMPDERVDAYLVRKLTAPPPQLPGVPEELARTITRALESDPAHRPSIQQFRDELATVSRTQPTLPGLSSQTAPSALAAAHANTAVMPAAPPPTPPTARSTDTAPNRPRSGVAMLAILLFGALAAVIAAVVLDARGQGSAPRTSQTDPITAASTPAPPTDETAPATVPPPATTAPPTTPSTSTATPTTTPTAATEEARQPNAEEFLREYYAAVEAGDYETSWAYLTPVFQAGRARSFEYYSSFWDANDVELRKVRLLETAENEALVRADLRWNNRGGWNTDEFHLVQQDGHWLIDRQESLDE